MENFEQYERAVAGSMLIDTTDEFTPWAIGYLVETDFSIPSCMAVYASVKRSLGEKKPHDMLSVSGVDFAELVAMTDLSMLSGARHHAEMVKTNAIKRRAIDMANSIQRGLSGEAFSNPDEVVEYVNNRLSLELPRIDRKAEDMASIIEEVQTILEEEASGKREPLRYGVRELDAATGGLWPSELTIVAAGPAAGKTAFALSTAVNVAKTGKNVLVCSLEMNRAQVGKRIMSNAGMLEGDAFKNAAGIKKLSPEHEKQLWERISEAGSKAGNLPIMVDDTTRTVQELVNKAMRLREKGKLDLVVLDYLQLMTSNKKHESRRHEVEHVSRELKLMSRDLGIPVIALSQLSREGQKNTKPRLFDLRESGAIEQDADNVIFLFDPEADQHLGFEIVQILLILAKQRSGRTGELSVMFNKKYQQFTGVQR